MLLNLFQKVSAVTLINLMQQIESKTNDRAWCNAVKPLKKKIVASCTLNNTHTQNHTYDVKVLKNSCFKHTWDYRVKIATD